MVEVKPQKVKLLITGNVNGEVTKLYQVVDNIQSKKGKFDALLCVGKFFPPTSDVSISFSSDKGVFGAIGTARVQERSPVESERA